MLTILNRSIGSTDLTLKSTGSLKRSGPGSNADQLVYHTLQMTGTGASKPEKNCILSVLNLYKSLKKKFIVCQQKKWIILTI